MANLPGERLRGQLNALVPGSPRYATEVVDLILAEARAVGASDVHLQPTPDGLDVRWRVDGVLHPVGRPAGRGSRRTSSPGSRCWPTC